LPAGFITPCLPMTAPSPPSGGEWLHEIKHDGLRLIARHDGHRVRLYSGAGDEVTQRFPLIVEAMARLPACTIDGIACDARGTPSFGLLQQAERDARVFLYAFDLIEIAGQDRRRTPLIDRKRNLASLLMQSGPGALAAEWVDGSERDGKDVLEQACAAGREGIVSKRKDSRYVAGRSPYWLKMTSSRTAPLAPAAG
jgi:bifunctional non-homologous end joining protein LigD